MLMASSPSEKDPFMVIDNSERPPVVAYGGRSPSKSPAERKRSGKAFKEATAPYMQATFTQNSPRGSIVVGGNITPRNRKQQFGELRWDNRHHVSPSLYNTQNHTFYKQFFDKSCKQKAVIAHRPEKTLDPFEENTIRGTRMPPWSPLGGEQRDIYGELAWIPNFQVTMSKDNGKRHRNFKEFFDKPRNYHLAASSSSAASSEFFKQNAPKGSVARPKKYFGIDSLTSSGYLRATAGTSGKDLLFNQTATSAGSMHGGSPYATPFVLEEERNNKYKIDDRLKQTLEFRQAIPFLRTNDQDYKQVVYKKKSHMRNGSGQSGQVVLTPLKVNKPLGEGTDIKKRVTHFLKRRELGWQHYVLPISKLNEEWHPSQKITFERI